MKLTRSMQKQQRADGIISGARHRDKRNVVRRNPFTGRKRKLPKRDLPRKRRKSLSSTVAERTYAYDAMKATNAYLDCCQAEITMAMEFLHATCENLTALTSKKKKLCAAIALQLIHNAMAYLAMAICCIELDSELLDLEHEDIGGSYYFPPKDLRIDTIFQSDNHADQQVRISKHELNKLLTIFEFDETIYVLQNLQRGGPLRTRVPFWHFQWQLHAPFSAHGLGKGPSMGLFHHLLLRPTDPRAP